ncbi:ATP-binding cassette domain-containing protein, partial [Glutamicibacter creatinolyticus]|uniref:ATP-binding cassette domain-containing protein n=1 Tax=Glutamicibacter creatinolyticus TaxID=162496 RepID=UPI003B983F1E
MPITAPTLPARSRAQIVLSDIWLALGANPILRGVDLVVIPTSRIAVVGENGRGKSTLLHVLSEHLTPDSGQVTRIGTLGIAEQEMSTDDQRTVGEVAAAAVRHAVAA